MNRDVGIKILSSDLISKNYYEWMNDKDVAVYLESNKTSHTKESLKEYIDSINSAVDAILFGIYLHDEHVGNIKIHKIDNLHRFAEVSLVIGKSFWGKGVGTAAIKLATEYAFKNLNLHKVISGIYDVNVGSIKSFEKNGYKLVGRLKEHRFFQGQYVDHLIFEIMNKDHK